MPTFRTTSQDLNLGEEPQGLEKVKEKTQGLEKSPFSNGSESWAPRSPRALIDIALIKFLADLSSHRIPWKL